MTGICAADPLLAEEYGWTYNRRMKTRSRREQMAADDPDAPEKTYEEPRPFKRAGLVASQDTASVVTMG